MPLVRTFSHRPAVLLQEDQIFPPFVHLLWRKAASFMKNALTLPENEFSAYKGGRNQHTAILQYSSDFGKGLFPATAQYAVHWIRSPHQRLVRIGAVRTYPARKVRFTQSDYSSFLCNHLRRGIRRLDMYRRVYRCSWRSAPFRWPIPATFLSFTTGRISSYIFRILSCLFA